jgi:hypothetical protein
LLRSTSKCTTSIDNVGKPEGKRSLEEPRRRWKDNIIMDLMEGVDWMHVVQDEDQLA